MRLFVLAWLPVILCLTATASVIPARHPVNVQNLDKRVPQQFDNDFMPLPEQVENHIDLRAEEDAVLRPSDPSSSSSSESTTTTDEPTTTTHDPITTTPDPTTSTTQSDPSTTSTPDPITSTPNPTTTTSDPTSPITSTTPSSSSPPPTTTSSPPTTTTHSDPTTSSSPASDPTTTTTSSPAPPSTTTTEPPSTTTPDPTTTVPPPTTTTSNSEPPPTTSTPSPVTTTTTPNEVTSTTTTPSPETSSSVTTTTTSSTKPTPTPITSAKVTSYTSHIGTGTDVTIVVSTAMVTVTPTDPALLAGGDSGGSSSNNNAAIIGGVIGGVGGAVLLGGLSVFLYKKHQKNKEFNEPYSTYDDDPGMSEYGPVTQRPLGSVGQHEGSDGGSYSQYHGQPPPLGNVTQQVTPGNYPPGDNNGPAYGQYNNPSAMGNITQQAGPGGAYNAGTGGGFSQYAPASPPLTGHVGGGGGGQYVGGDYGQYQGPVGFIAPGDYRHSLSTGSQENDTAADHSLPSSRHGSQNLGPGGVGHYRGPSDLSYEVTYPPNEVAAPPVPSHKPNTRD